MAVSDPKQLFASAPVARLATVSADHRPHVVPVVFAAAGDLIYTAVDGKPKSGKPLRRLADIAECPEVSLVVDHYEDDWSRLWWVRAEGTARIHDDGPEVDVAFRLLRAKYPQYQTVSLDGPVIALTVRRWSSWTG
ncbi:TIGR03668 family PPOX class F420-dependent oxidoreductase [Williamsia muralis]|uniref:TIGR03668 family PPOX class F420-dependent oxidoreductase n=1 Tax=Williamsia marianensis TaxID=85044 RepID=A0A2G3PS34_WILMA|nr:TIGR03668 family PPOX class F420-dependent oxidoreductase [Williamsia marianensis]PHV68659.1 TIGR03668 family PPOX class F420-dependent oxidoreductase [Williamsia marianensis]